MKTNLIGLAGKKGSGKDTVANMMFYINAEGTRASFEKWKEMRNSITPNLNIVRTAFADPIKDTLSNIFNIDREAFDNRTKKELMYYCPKLHKFIAWNDIDRNGYIYVDLHTLNEWFDFEDLLNPKTTYKTKYPVFTLRELMQWFGTDIGRKYFGQDVWVNATKIRITNIINSKRICYVTDVRYNNECEAIKELNGRVILIDRPSDSNDEHSSENLDIKPHIILPNNSTLSRLFYRVLTLMNELL